MKVISLFPAISLLGLFKLARTKLSRGGLGEIVPASGNSGTIFRCDKLIDLHPLKRLVHDITARADPAFDNKVLKNNLCQIRQAWIL